MNIRARECFSDMLTRWFRSGLLKGDFYCNNYNATVVKEA